MSESLVTSAAGPGGLAGKRQAALVQGGLTVQGRGGGD